MTDQPTDTKRCQSCSMTIDNGTYCQYCTDENGSLFDFDETFERFVQFAMGRDSALDRSSAESNTLQFMATMPAWQEHPALRSRQAR